jgi:acetyl esterase/lipase
MLGSPALSEFAETAMHSPGAFFMQRLRAIAPIVFLVEIVLACASSRADEPPYVRKVDVIYGRKYGTALTMDVFTPTKSPNGAGVVMVISGGFFSSHEAIQPLFVLPLVNRGYTVFAVLHGSQPEYTVPEIVKDMNRAVRFIRNHASEYGVAPDRLGVTGASAGGHLSLMLGTAGTTGNPVAKDVVDRESSRVQAVACFFPPTDLLNYGAAGHELIHAEDHGLPFRAAFQYREMDPKSRLWVSITDEKRLKEIAREISPVYHVSADDPPTLLIHGDADELVPLQQSQEMIKALEKAGVRAKLVVKPKAGHGWVTMGQDISQIADWFDTHLKPHGATDAKAAPAPNR